MLRDTRKGMKTEIDYLNGYVVKRGEEMGIKCFLNYMITHLVKAKTMMIERERDASVPFVKSVVDFGQDW